MHQLNRGRAAMTTLLALAAAVVLVACGGSSSGDATKLLQQTFSGSHRVNSGNLNFTISVNPSGSRTITGPISFTFGGPFQSLGAGKLPQSNFNVTVRALGKTGTLGILSTGTNGYVTLQGASYQLPNATFQKLESSFAQLSSSPGGGSGTLGRLGIQPLHWLVSPSIAGDENIGGTETTHIHAGVNVAALLGDLNTFLQKASSLGVSGTTRIPSGLSQATRQRIAGEVQSPSFDVWTGKSDKTVRKLLVKLTIPVSGQVSTLLGGLRSAAISLTMQYANLNQPQTISAPTNVRPFTEFTTRLQSLLASVQGSLGSSATGGLGTGGLGSTTGGTSSTPTGSTAGSSSSIQKYTNCIQAAGSDVTKMQQCAPLLNGK